MAVPLWHPIASTLALLCLLPTTTHAFPLLPRDDQTQVLCGPSGWDNVCLFFLLNYITHVFTIKTFPGNRFNVSIRWAIAALLIPYSGAVRGCVAIANCRYFFKEKPLQHASRAGALCAFRRGSNWRPSPGDVLTGCKINGESGSGLATLTIIRSETEDIERDDYVVHGHHPAELPAGIVMSKLPADIIIEPPNVGHAGKTQLARSLVLLKSLAGIIQLSYAVLTLIRTWGPQITLYGYAAYGLTIIPYAVSSLINLIAHCVNPDYPALFLVENEILRTMQQRGIYIDGYVGRIDEETEEAHTILVKKVDELTDGNRTTLIVEYELLLCCRDLESVTEYIFKEKYLSSTDSLTLKDSSINGSEASSPRVSLDITDYQNSYLKDGSDHACHHPASSPISIPATEIIIGDFGPLRRGNLSRWPRMISSTLLLLGLMTPYLITYVFAQFNSSDTARMSDEAWAMSWLACGQVFGLAIGWRMQKSDGGGVKRTLQYTLVCLAAGAPAIGGFVMVARMLLRSGDCELGPDSDVL